MVRLKCERKNSLAAVETVTVGGDKAATKGSGGIVKSKNSSTAVHMVCVGGDIATKKCVWWY